jgi:hypothetical protein
MNEFKIIFVLSPEYSPNDIVNLKRTFSLEGVFVGHDRLTKETVEKITKLVGVNKDSVGFCLTVNKKKRIEKVYLF